MSNGAVSLRMILRAVGYAWGVRPNLIRSARLGGDVRGPRHAVCLLAREMTTLSYPAIGRLLGNRDHSTIIQSADRGLTLRDGDPDFARRYVVAREMILGELAQADRWQDADAVAAAGRVMDAADPWRAATDLSVDEVVAVAARAVALEQVAASTYQLLARVDELERLRREPASPTARARAGEIAASIDAIADAVADALDGLGYEYAEPAQAPDPENMHERPAAE